MTVNVSKTRLSFDMSIGGEAVPCHQYMAPNGEAFIKWCGLIINKKTLNVQVSVLARQPAGSLTLVVTTSQALLACCCVSRARHVYINT